MKRGRLVTAAAFAAVLTLSTLTGAAAVPVVQTTRVAPVKSSIWDPETLLDLLSYRSTISGTQLSGAGGRIERAAWSAANGRLAAQSASIYNVRMTYGMEKFADLDHIRPIPANTPLDPKAWGKFKKPTFGGLGLKSGAGPLTAALIGWELRGTMADGVMGMMGLGTANAAVCGNVTGEDGFDGFNSWISGQDCELYRFNAEYGGNSDVSPGIRGGKSCNSAAQCVELTGIAGIYLSPSGGGDQFNYFIFKGTGFPALTADNFNGPAFVEFQNENTGTGWGGSWGLHQLLSFGITPPSQFNADACNTTTSWCIAGPSAVGHAPALGVYRIYGGPTITPTENDLDPMRYIRCEITGSDGHLYTGTGPGYRESEGGLADPIAGCPQLPPGIEPRHLKLTMTSPGLVDEVMVDQDALDSPAADAPESEANLGAPQAEFCRTKVCILDLVLKSKNVTCFSQAETCDGWWDDPQKESKYGCQYGGHDVAIGECAMYAHIFNTQKRLEGNPYADPVTGDDTGTATGPSVDKAIMGEIPRAAFTGRDCFGSGYGSVNPMQWVLRPLQCFGEWAMVPRQSVVQTAVLKSDTAWDKTMFGKIPALVAPFQSIPTWSGCTGIPIDIEQTWPIKWGIHWNFGAACTGPTAAAAGVVRLIVGGLLGGAAILALTDYLGFSIGFRGFGRRSDLS